MRKIISILLSAMILLSVCGCGNDSTNTVSDEGFTQSEVEQILAAQEAWENGIPDSWLKPEGTVLEHDRLTFKVNNTYVTDELPQHVIDHFESRGELGDIYIDENGKMRKYRHCVVMNVTIKNTVAEEVETYISVDIECGENFEWSSSCAYFEKSQNPQEYHDYCKYIFAPNEELTTDFIYFVHEADLDGDIYMSPGVYAVSYVKVLDAPYPKPEQKENPDVEIPMELWDTYMRIDDRAIYLPYPEKGTVKKSDILYYETDNGKHERELTIKDLEWDEAIEYLNIAIFEDLDTIPYFMENGLEDFYEPFVDEEAGTAWITAGCAFYVYELNYTKATKEMKIHIYRIPGFD